MKRLYFLAILLGYLGGVAAQENLTYQKPPKEILELADYERVPALLMDSKKQNILFRYRNTYKTLSELSAEEMKLAGLRLDPQKNISSTVIYNTNLKYKHGRMAALQQVQGLPTDAQLAYFSFSPDESKVAFTNTSDKGIELWCFDFSTGKAFKLTEGILNANMGSPFTWLKDGLGFLIKVLPTDRKGLINTKETIPSGPTVSVSEAGSKAQNRTYQDLLKNKNDEDNFETLVYSELYKLDLNGQKTLWKAKDLYVDESISPDGSYIMLTTLHRPYSYLVPFSRFPMKSTIYNLDGSLVKEINDKPLVEELPKGFMAVQQGRRNITWQKDKPSTIYWVEALDNGDPAVKADYRDEVFTLDAPFSGEPKSVVKTINRYAGIIWGNDNTAVLYDRWWNTRNVKTYVFDPSGTKEASVIFDRSSEDTYGDPGDFDTQRNLYGEYTLSINAGKAYLVGKGFTAKGQFPFIDEIDLNTKKTKRIFQSGYTDKKLEISSIIDSKTGEILVSLESPTEYPNYYILNTKKRIAPIALTHFENPFKAISGVHKQVIKYKRADGVDLSATLYLPAGYDLNKKDKLPMIMWAYPTEYKDKDNAGQNTTNPNEFIYPSYGSPIYWVTRGYAILDDAAFPIIGEGNEEPNDTYIKQLVANAKAAIDAVDSLGYIDRRKVAVGGHSYGAFMTANLLTHSDLFAAGIARSGAYNRTLTPFGFQSEERNYWEATDVYNAMSPFMHADKMKTPILLIHGGNDNNSGTFTLQSERYFAALKGLGAPARLVILPLESHGYAAKESILHTLWEQDQWLEKYVKNRK